MTEPSFKEAVDFLNFCKTASIDYFIGTPLCPGCDRCRVPVAPGGQKQDFIYTEVAFTRNKIKVLVQTLDHYEATILLAYTKRLIKSRKDCEEI